MNPLRRTSKRLFLLLLSIIGLFFVALNGLLLAAFLPAPAPAEMSLFAASNVSPTLSEEQVLPTVMSSSIRVDRITAASSRRTNRIAGVTAARNIFDLAGLPPSVEEESAPTLAVAGSTKSGGIGFTKERSASRLVATTLPPEKKIVVTPTRTVSNNSREDTVTTRRRTVGGRDNGTNSTLLEDWGLEIQMAVANDTARNPLCVGKEHLLAVIHASQREVCEAARQQSSATTNSTPAKLPSVCTPHTLCHELPDWSQVTSLYGTEPVILGMDTCASYQALIAKAKAGKAPPLHADVDKPVYNSVGRQLYAPKHDVVKAMVRVAGLYNSGTNALRKTIADNLMTSASVKKLRNEFVKKLRNEFVLDVPWGKHIPLEYKWTNTWRPQEIFVVKDYVLPVVIVRDP
jgi:hypothetical protein